MSTGRTVKAIRRLLTHHRLAYLIYIVHATLWLLLAPPWQGPDEPGHYEYALLLARLHRPPRPADMDPDLEARIIRALGAADFWTLNRVPRPDPLPHTFAQDPFLKRSGTQLGNESPLYYIVPALLTRLLPGPDLHCRAARLWSALLGLGIIVLAARSAPLLWPRAPGLQRAFPLLLALLPMPTFIHATFNSNALADLVGAAFFYFAWRLLRGNRSWRTRVGFGGTVILALLVKRTTLLLLPLALGLPCLLCRRRRIVHRTLLVAAVMGLVLFPRAPQWSDGWFLGRAHRPAPRVRVGPGEHAMLLTGRGGKAPREFLVQDRVGYAVAGLRGKAVLFRARLQSLDGPTWACLSVSDGWARRTTCAWVPQRGRTVYVRHLVHPAATYVRLVVGLGNPREQGVRGRILVDKVRLIVGTSLEEGVENGDAERPYHRVRGWLHRLGWLSEERASPREHLVHWALAAAVLFTSFWGNFGWLKYPLPVPVYGVLAFFTLVVLIGWVRWWRGTRGPDRAVWTFTGAGGMWFLLAMFLAAWRVDWLPQGRYLFPALLPLGAMGISGWAVWFPEAYRERAVWGLVAGAVLLTFLAFLVAP